ncbi:hypothetical protein RHSIM_Rhsim11G0075700 [Rhododendron simsii]|uniref:Uncharacterized protein n=1 Tax=Rhododendron simsii TaxID=118357 RepID=A0A834L8T7_RHOSS|nr:hypothetical protein RHSIM_Rhsim11G0075700 [Rhododendron simsii]
MDREQKDMQFLGLFGIYQESYKIIFNFRRIFSKISLAFILPLSLILLANIAVSDSLSPEGAAFWLIEFVYLTFFLVFSVLFTSAVVYTGYDVPIMLWRVTIKRVYIAGLVFFLATMIFNVVVVGNVHMTVVWWLAGIVSVLEDIKGIKAMTKSRNLIQGKMWIAIVILLKLEAAIFGILILFESQVVHTGSFGIAGRLAFGFLCLSMLLSVFLFALVIETMIYFMCKSYHHENINKLSLSDHLDEV